MPELGKVDSNQFAKRINSIMQTSGFYDQVGEFNFKLGLPGKTVLVEMPIQSISVNAQFPSGAQS